MKSFTREELSPEATVSKMEKVRMEVERGAIGSCLHQTSDGMWVAYSRWPDQKTRDASWPGENASSDELPQEIRGAVIVIQDCLDPERNYQIFIWK